MSLETTSKKFVELCNQGKNFDVMQSMYASDVISVEADGSQWSGKDSVIRIDDEHETVHTRHDIEALAGAPSWIPGRRFEIAA
jgi:hypothetical protein